MLKRNQAAPKRQLSKDERKEYKRQESLIRESIYPVLLQHSKSVKDAQNIVKTLLVGMDWKFQKRIQEYEKYLSGDKLEKLNLHEDMADQVANKVTYPAERAIIELLQQETVGASKSMLQGLEKVLEAAVIQKMLKTPLQELKTQFYE